MKIKTTALSKFSKCLIRGKPVAITPEEGVRQSVLYKMIDELGFPKSLISVERALGSRRTDIVCYTKEMAPLLLIECKAQVLDAAAVRQAFGYNDTLQAPFVCLVNSVEMKTLWYEAQKLISIPFLPKFDELYAVSRKL